MKWPLLAAIAISTLPLIAHAAEPAVPGAGSILQQNQQLSPPAPSPAATGLAIEQPGGATLPASAPFVVKIIEISGNTVFDTPTLHALVAPEEGTSVTLPQLGQVVARITDYYRAHGYPLARAVIPAQTIQDGIVRIVIIEARYGQVELDNHSRVVDSLLRSTLSPLQSAQVISAAPLDRALLLLQKAGLIQLKQDANGAAVHILANPRQLKLVELDAAQLPRSLDDVDAAVINANFALDAGLNPRTGSLLSETRDSPYANVLSVNAGAQPDASILALAKALTSSETRSFITAHYGGAVYPAE